MEEELIKPKYPIKLEYNFVDGKYTVSPTAKEFTDEQKAAVRQYNKEKHRYERDSRKLLVKKAIKYDRLVGKVKNNDENKNKLQDRIAKVKTIMEARCKKKQIIVVEKCNKKLAAKKDQIYALKNVDALKKKDLQEKKQQLKEEYKQKMANLA